MTDVHRDVQEIVSRTVLPEVIQVHDIAIPYPAELWVNGQREHEDGTAMFSIGDGGYLTAEYFAYDVQRQLLLPVPSIILAGSPPVSDCAAGPLRCGS